MSIREQLSKAMDGWKKDVIIPADMYEVVVCYFSGPIADFYATSALSVLHFVSSLGIVPLSVIKIS